MILKVLSISGEGDSKFRWCLYDDIKRIGYDETLRHCFESFESKAEFVKWVESVQIDSILPYTHDLNNWDFKRHKFRVCIIDFTTRDHKPYSLAFSTKAYIQNDQGKTIESINLMI